MCITFNHSNLFDSISPYAPFTKQMSDEERKRKKRRIKLRYSSEGKKKMKRKYQRRKENKKEKKKPVQTQERQAPKEPTRHPNYVPQSKHIPYRRGLGKQYGESRRHDGLESSPSNDPKKTRYSNITPKEHMVESPSPSPISDATWVRKVLRCKDMLEFSLRVDQKRFYLREQDWYRNAAASINAASQNKILSPTELEEMLVNYIDAVPYPVDLVEKMLELVSVCVCLFVYLLISLYYAHLTLSIIIYTG